MDNKQLGNKIIELVGGEENVNSLVHCATRLRFKLKDQNKANKKALEEIPDVLTVVEKGGQYQVVVGNKVGKVYTEIMNNHHIQASGTGGRQENEKVGVAAKVFEYISGTFSPLIPALAGAGMIKALLAVLAMLNWIDVEGTTYAVLNAASSGLFYFLPIFIGISAAKQLNVHPFVGGAIAAGLLDPNFTALLERTGDISFIGIPLIATNYTSTVFPLLIAMAIYAPLERLVKKYTPDTIQLFFVPMIGILVMMPLTSLVFGPFAQYVSAGIGAGITLLSGISAVLTGIIIASIWPFLVILGVHWGVVPIMIDNFSKGGDIIGPITSGAVFAVMGIAFGIFLRSRKNKDLRSLALAGTLSGLLAGVIEPILYGLVLRYRRLMPLVLISGAIGGAIISLFDVRVATFVFQSIFSIPAFSPMVGYVIGIGTAFTVGTILAFIFGIEGKKKNGEAEEETKKEIEVSPTITENEGKEKYELTTPLSGEMIPLEDVNDPVFSSGAMGKGVGVEPSEGVVVAPFDGKVVTLFPTKHAIGLVSEDGIELLIHIGIDTVELNGKHYEAHVKADAIVKKGQKLITFDVEGIKKEGYQTITPVIITNTADYLDITPTKPRYVGREDEVLTVIK
ncbi:beta-glucoside-specific PTS transporter subunit IIABC [Priestia endophytica]|uniref:beta-glucoside-specific PTS transporter subunit IIABC n=1 Tax=Priestia endophytica TaxID=135735 RepID=UPI002E1CFCC5|nr:beta-glucoside-specific PTS transporter subunit IIABC [Priestia endophytica]MED4074066.1 beta-glucoside-specific PTS transporter subunit IIABC [Priestia endophytica]